MDALPLAETWTTYALLLAAGFAATEPWRWLGLALARRIDVESGVFAWTRAVSTAIVAALVARLVVDPSGALAAVPLWVRLAAFALGLAAYGFFGRRTLVGVGVGVAALVVAELILA